MASKIQNYLDDNYQDARREMVRVSYLNNMRVSSLVNAGSYTIYCSNTKNNIFIPFTKMTKDQFVASLIVLCEASGASVDIVKDLVSEKENASVESVFNALVEASKKSYVADYDVAKEGPLTQEKLTGMKNRAYASAYVSNSSELNTTMARMQYLKGQKGRKGFAALLSDGLFTKEQFELLNSQLDSDIAEIDNNVMAQFAAMMNEGVSVERE